MVERSVLVDTRPLPVPPERVRSWLLAVPGVGRVRTPWVRSRPWPVPPGRAAPSSSTSPSPERVSSDSRRSSTPQRPSRPTPACGQQRPAGWLITRALSGRRRHAFRFR